MAALSQSPALLVLLRQPAHVEPAVAAFHHEYDVVNMIRHSEFQLRTARPEEYPDALHLMFQSLSVTERESYEDEFLSANDAGSFPLDHVQVAIDGLKVVGTALLSIAAGRLALVWPPCVANEMVIKNPEAAASLRKQLARAVRQVLDSTDIAIAQCLVARGHGDDEILEAMGLQQSVTLVQLRLPLSAAERKGGAPNTPSHTDTSIKAVRFSFSEHDRTRFVNTLGATFIDSLDAAEFSGARTPEESLEGHLSASGFRPDLSYVYHLDGRDSGVVLVAQSGSDLELLYIGVSPAARGFGLGRYMLYQLIADARASNAAGIVCAVDDRNHYAIKLYDEFDFAVEDTQEVWLYRPEQLSRTE